MYNMLMLSIFKGKQNKELEDLITKTRNSMSNNYKDAAQEYFKEFSDKLDELLMSGSLNDKQKDRYIKMREELSEELKGFTHKDQKPYWH